MNAITQFLLAGAAFGALATTPAAAGGVPPFLVTALHAGHVVNKTRIHNPCRINCTYTYLVYTSVPASDLGQTVHLYATYYKFNSAPNGTYTICSKPKQWLRLATKKTIYAKIGKSTETYSYGCPSGSTVFYGDTYKLFNKAGFGQTDHFESTLFGKFKLPGGRVYKGSMLLDVVVNIGE